MLTIRVKTGAFKDSDDLEGFQPHLNVNDLRELNEVFL